MSTMRWGFGKKGSWFRCAGAALILGASPAWAGPREDGDAALNAGRMKEADAAYTLALTAAPGDALALLGRGQARAALGDNAGAAADLDQAVTLAPRNSEAWRQRGLLRLNAGDLKGAMDDMDRVVILAPKASGAYASRAAVDLVSRDYTAAIADYSQAIKLRPDTASYYHSRGYAWELTQDNDMALLDYEQALKLNAKDTFALTHRAAIHEGKGELRDAADDYRAAVAADPKQKKAADRLAALEKDPNVGAEIREADLAAAKPAAPESLTAAPEPESPAKPAAPVIKVPVVAPEWLRPTVKHAPSPARLPLPVVSPAPFLVINKLSSAAYAGAVSAAMEGMKLVLGPQSEEESAKLEKAWSPAFQFPCAEVVDYLNQLNPLLAQFLAYRTAAGYSQAQFSRHQTDAFYAAAMHNDSAAEEAMVAAHSEADRLDALRCGLQKTGAAIQALGDPPDPADLMHRARKRSEDAETYINRINEADLMRDLHNDNLIKIRLIGDATFHNEGFEFPNSDPNAELTQYNRKETYRSYDPAHEGSDYHLRWNGDTFFASVSEKSGSADSAETDDITIWGRVSPDGRRLLELKWAHVLRRPDTLLEFVLGIANLPFTHRSLVWMGGTDQYLNYGVDDNPDRNGLITTQHAAHAIFSLKSDLRGKMGVPIPPPPGGGLFPASTARTAPQPFVYTMLEFRPTNILVAFQHLKNQPVVPFNAPPEAMGAAEVQAYVDEAKPQVVISGELIDLPAIAERKRLEEEAKRLEGEAARKIAEADQKANAEKIESLKKDIEETELSIQQVRDSKGGDPKQITFELETKNAEIQGIKDEIAGLQTGVYAHTPTDFDEHCRSQFIAQCQDEVQQMAKIDRDLRIANSLQANLEQGEKDAIYQETQKIFADGAALDPARWKAVNDKAYGLWEGRLEEEKKTADQTTQMWDDRVTYAEWTKTGADTAFGLVSGAGGFKITGLVYSFATSSLEGGLDRYFKGGTDFDVVKSSLYDGTKAVLTGLNQAVDYTWSAVETYNESSGKTPRDKMWDVAGTLGTKFVINTVTGALTEGAADYVRESAGPAYKPTAEQAIAAAKFKQQMEMDQALAKDFLDTHSAWRRAVLQGAPEADVARLQAEVRRKACSVNSSYGAKVYMKYQTLPVQQRAFTQTMREVHEDLMPDLVARLRAGTPGSDGTTQGAYDGQIRFFPIRNASSGDSVGIDYDLALAEQPAWISHKDGSQTRNVWLTRDGKPTSAEVLMNDAQKTWESLYRERTGYSATVSFENITSKAHAEAYKDMTWISITEPGHIEQIDPKWAQQAGDVTRVKANEMQSNDKLLLQYYQKKQEACRGTEKDIRTKLITLLNNVEDTKGSGWTPAQKEQHADVKAYWTQVADVMGRFGRGEMDPIEADRQIHLLSGGRGLDDLVDKTGTMIEAQAKMGR
jgi:tetratricopeptide (TPR) repeat protein